MDSADADAAGGEGVSISTPLIKAQKDNVDLNKPVNSTTADGGIFMDPEVLGRILIENGVNPDRMLEEDEKLNVQVTQNKAHTKSHDPEVANKGNSGVAAIGIKAGKKALNVESEDGMIIS